MKWGTLPPAEPCSDPDGHVPMEVRAASSDVPVAVLCERCGQRYVVVTFTADRG